MIISSLIASVVSLPSTPSDVFSLPSGADEESNPYLNGEYRTILTLVSVLPLGKAAKRLADRVIDHLDGVQNLRQAVYDYKVRERSGRSLAATARKADSLHVSPHALSSNPRPHPTARPSR